MQDQLFSSLMCFYANDSHKERFTDLVSDRTKLSQREIDWFATNTSKSENVSVSGMNIYHSYRSHLKAYSKRYFDPFRRRDRINVFSGKYRISTTLGQMNFYRWIISNDLDTYRITMIIKEHCHQAVLIGAHVIFSPIGVPNVLIGYGLGAFKSSGRCDCLLGKVLLFEMIYFWPLIVLAIPFAVPTMIREWRSERRERQEAKKLHEKKMKYLPIIKKHHEQIGFQTDYPENVVETLVTDTLDYLEHDKVDNMSWSWAYETIKRLLSEERSFIIQGVPTILKDCEIAYRVSSTIS